MQAKGIVSYKIDEMEQFLRFEDYSTVSLKQIDALRREYENRRRRNPLPFQRTYFVSVLTDFRYRILPKRTRNHQKIKGSHRIADTDFKQRHYGKRRYGVYRTDPDGRSFAVFYSDEKHEVLSDQRFLNIEIICDAYSGFKVPLTALFDVEENKAKIIIVETVLHLLKMWKS